MIYLHNQLTYRILESIIKMISKSIEIGVLKHADWTEKAWRLKFIPHAPGETWLETASLKGKSLT